MMAKMFYTLDETKSALDKSEEEIKQLAREGRLREFRDGPRLMFKADQVESLKAEITGGSPRDQVDLSAETTGPLGMIDSKGASGSVISLADTGGRGGSSIGIGLAPKDDTALAADISSGSLGGVPSPGKPGSGSGLAGSAAGRSAINVFSPDEASADPMAQTNIQSGISDQINIEGVGSGSGLLDLTRESDDTSLGAELLDEISPGGSSGSRKGITGIGGTGFGATGAGGTAVGGTAAGASGIANAPVRGRGAVGTPIYVEARDPSSDFFGGLCLGAAAFVIFGSFVLVSAVLGNKAPEALADAFNQPTVYLAGAGILAAVIFGFIGFMFGKLR
ncbi:MAG TPA: hypothetical protein PLD59_02555 [Tepidisphaeraceae bacterium]|nr:hypothetical protein [Tepidisphaeraceae bacterium]